jgi:hypothetical protein
MKTNAVLLKADISQLLDVLLEMWDTGIDFVDVEITSEKNTITLSFIDEYIAEEFKDDLSATDFFENNIQVRSYLDDEYEEEDLTDEDLEQLM